MRNKILFTLTALLLMATGMRAQTPYAVYDSGILTFKYGDKPEGHYELNKETTDPGWLEDKSNITKVVFEESFKDARPTTCYKWFYGFNKLKTIEGLGNLNTSSVTDMSNMFASCTRLIELDLRSFNTANVKDMYNMFASCIGLIKLDLSSFNTANVKEMSYMFFDCERLLSLDLSNFNTSNKPRMDYMFSYCSDLGKLDMSKVTGIKELAAHADLQKRSIIIIVPESTNIANDVSEENYIVMGNKTLFVRTFAANNPHTLYLPFAVSTTDINGCFYEYDSCDGNSVKFTKVKEGATKANKAYLFKSETDEKIVFTGEGAIEYLPTFEEEYGDPGLYGRYTTKTFTAAEANEGIYYGWAGGEFKRAGKDAKVKPNRAYLKLPASDASNAPARLSVKFEDENTTGIINIEREDSRTESPIYNLNGQRVGNSYRGVVIKNGKKIFNKKTR